MIFMSVGSDIDGDDDVIGISGIGNGSIFVSYIGDVGDGLGGENDDVGIVNGNKDLVLTGSDGDDDEYVDDGGNSNRVCYG